MKLNEFNNTFQTEQDCLKYIVSLKENKCIRCYWTNLNTSDLRKGNKRCLKCHQTFSILHGTFYKSQIPLKSWFYLIFRWINTKQFHQLMLQKNLSSFENCWRMGHKSVVLPNKIHIYCWTCCKWMKCIFHMGLKTKEDPWWIKPWLLVFMKKQPIN